MCGRLRRTKHVLPALFNRNIFVIIWNKEWILGWGLCISYAYFLLFFVDISWMHRIRDSIFWSKWSAWPVDIPVDCQFYGGTKLEKNGVFLQHIVLGTFVWRLCSILEFWNFTQWINIQFIADVKRRGFNLIDQKCRNNGGLCPRHPVNQNRIDIDWRSLQIYFTVSNRARLDLGKTLLAFFQFHVLYNDLPKPKGSL